MLLAAACVKVWLPLTVLQERKGKPGGGSPARRTALPPHGHGLLTLARRETTLKRVGGGTGFQASNKYFLNVFSSAAAAAETVAWSCTLALMLLLVSLKLRELPAKIPCCCEAN